MLNPKSKSWPNIFKPKLLSFKSLGLDLRITPSLSPLDHAHSAGDPPEIRWRSVPRPVSQNFPKILLNFLNFAQNFSNFLKISQNFLNFFKISHFSQNFLKFLIFSPTRPPPTPIRFAGLCNIIHLRVGHSSRRWTESDTAPTK